MRGRERLRTFDAWDLGRQRYQRPKAADVKLVYLPLNGGPRPVQTVSHSDTDYRKYIGNLRLIIVSEEFAIIVQASPNLELPSVRI